MQPKLPPLPEAAKSIAKTARPRLRAMNLEAMKALLAEGGFPAFRAKQVYHWIFKKGADSVERMNNLPKELRAFLTERTDIGAIALVDAEGGENATRKVVFELADGKFVESVVMRDEGTGRTGLCVSSQVGCAVGCTFCLTGFGGFQRHCTPDEIVGQVIETRNGLLLKDERIHTIVFMGMGEPLLNVPSVTAAIRLMTDPDGMEISPRRITVSTSGIVTGMEAFGREETGVNMAVSLNATTDEARTRIMPLNARWPIGELIEACRRFPMKPRQRMTVEYVLLRGINDTPGDAERLTRILHSLPCKVNVIMFNPHAELKFEPVDEATLDRFVGILARANFTVSVRWSKGREIEAACGQLAAHHFRRAKDSAAGAVTPANRT